MPSLSKLIKAKIRESGLKVTAAARISGISFPSFHAALSGRATPNARSIGKYANFLGISEDQVIAASGRRSGEEERGMGRRILRNAAADRRKHRGRPPGSRNRPGAAASRGSRSLAELGTAIAEAAAILKDLASAVRSAG